MNSNVIFKKSLGGSESSGLETYRSVVGGLVAERLKIRERYVEEILRELRLDSLNIENKVLKETSKFLVSLERGNKNIWQLTNLEVLEILDKILLKLEKNSLIKPQNKALGIINGLSRSDLYVLKKELLKITV
ncbi:MAG: hypothetical protein KAI16_00855 [Candidatus Pacebacteria bacterium]|nr:hypothetical protein [Candidatus Paceibacterota bacterium]